MLTSVGAVRRCLGGNGRICLWSIIMTKQGFFGVALAALLNLACVPQAPAGVIAPIPPSSQSGSTYNFTAVYTAGTTLYFDPPITSAIFQINSGPNFSGVIIPTQSDLVDSSLTVTSPDGTGSVSVGGSEFMFVPPVNTFTLSGFSPSDNPVPPNFIFGLDFASSGAVNFTLRETPEPAGFALMAIGGAALTGYGLWRRKKGS
jgi:hypothetical protein